MGELHLEILQHKLVKEKRVDVRVGKPRVAYKETITRAARAEGKFVHQSGRQGPVRPRGPRGGAADDGRRPLGAEDRVSRRTYRPIKSRTEYIAAVERGVKEAAGNGSLAGYTVIGVRATAGGRLVPFRGLVRSGVRAGGGFCFRKGSEGGRTGAPGAGDARAGIVPDAYFGAVQADLLSKRGLITDCRVHGNMRVVDAKVPLVELFGYSSDIRSLTAGRGSFTMEPLTYERVPDQVAKGDSLLRLGQKMKNFSRFFLGRWLTGISPRDNCSTFQL